MNILTKMLFIIINILHLILFILPYSLFFLPIKITKNSNSIKFLILIILLTPLHWKLFGDLCILNIIKSKIDIDNKEKWLTTYNDFIYLRYLKLHFIISYILLWYYIFFRNNIVVC
jgi:hypothetical protein